MDKSILKKFAIESREMLMRAVENELNKYYVDENLEKTQSGDLIILKNDNITLEPLTFDEFNKRATLISRIKDLSEDGSFESGKKRVIEETAYTWFNRIVAIRYMELNDMLPLTKDNQSLGIRVLSSVNNESHPEILKLGNLTNTGLDLKIDFDKYNKLLNENEQFNYVLKLICNKFGTIIPQVFDGITDYIDLLLPENLLSYNGFVTKVIKEVPESNFKEGVEIIGWLYQYYNQTEKDRAMSSNEVYKKSEIPYVTQLFTPDWIVKYMVENSLGKYWIEHNGDIGLANNWKYFIKNNVEEKNGKISLLELKIIDPCCGSGHILVYAFEVLYQIYKEQGYNKNDIPEMILTNNLYGLDIDDRAGQLSILSIILKAREYDQYIFNKKIIKNLNIMSIQETNSLSRLDLDIIKGNNEINEIIDYVYESFKNAKEIGSLLNIEKKEYEKVINEINLHNMMSYNIFDIQKMKVINEIFCPILYVAKILVTKFDIVVTNPPYMGQGKMTSSLKDYLKRHYKSGKTDLCTAFMLIKIIKNNGYLAMINQQAWMSLESFKDLRKEILENNNITTMIHLGFGTFGADFGTTTFVLQKSNDSDGIYFSTREVKTSEDKEREYLKKLVNNDFYLISKKRFYKIPETIIAYWLKDNQFAIFENNELFGKYGETKKGVLSGNDKRFLRFWYEVFNNKIGFNLLNHKDMVEKNYKWIPVTSGGNYRKWYGNFENVINLENDGYEIKNNKENSYRLRENRYYFRECVTWSEVSMKGFSVRYVPRGILFGNSGPVCFFNDNILYYLGFLNSKISTDFLKLLSPTLTFGPEQVKRIPIIICEEYKEKIKALVDNNVEIMKEDWDSYETSWNYNKHPLIEYKSGGGYDKDINKWNYRIDDAFKSWKSNCEEKFKLLKQNEEELNRIFIDIYGLQDELIPEVEDKDITFRKADREREIKSLISYAVGCMFGRYSLDEDGLIYAGGNFDKNRYKTIEVDLDNIIPVTEEKDFKDDIVERFIKFIESVYGKETLNENLDYIADTLGRKNNENAEVTIRRYFVNDFYKDHIKTYQKKPIYWLFESGKKNGFKCLIYMHRYDENLVAKIRLDYLYKIQRIYESRLQEIKIDLEDNNLSNYNAKKLEKKQEILQIKLEEIKKYNDKLSTIGDKRITIDLDDGVTENYKKFTYIDPLTNEKSSILAEEKTIIPKKK